MVEDVEKELEHSSLQEQLDKELKELDKRLEQKEVNYKKCVRICQLHSLRIKCIPWIVHFFIFI